MAIDPDAVGRASDPVEVSWDRDDALLYAVAVGAGQDPLDELALTTENSQGISQQVLPSFAALLSQQVTRPDVGDFDRAKLLHAEQHVTLHSTLPIQGRTVLVAEVTDIEDKGKGALVRTAVRGTDPNSGALVFTTESSAFIRGEGGFDRSRLEGGGRVSDDWEAPDRSPDHERRLITRPEQALLYRLTGDRNPLHSDPVFAARGGFDRPILHGMCTFGFTCRALVATAGQGDASAVTSMGGRFKASVLPGESLDVRVWIEGDRIFYQSLRADGTVVIDRGIANARPGIRPPDALTV